MTTLWYRRPAETWTEALPVGNGRIGGMVFGGVADERIALNDDTLWSGGPSDWNNPGGPQTLGEVRAFLAAGDYERADEMAKRMMGPYTQSYLALGDLNLKFDRGEQIGEVAEYRRWLDLATGVAGTEYVLDGTRFTREVFCSNPDQVLVIRLTAEGPGRLDFTATLASQLRGRSHCRGGLVLSVKAPALVDPTYYRRGKIVFDSQGEGMRSSTIVDVTSTDGTVTYSSWPVRANALRVTGATHVTLVLSTATSFNGYRRSPTRAGRDERAYARLPLDLARRKPFATLRRTHLEDHAGLFDRVSLSLDAHDLEDRPTDELLAARDDAAAGRRLAELMFHYGRYLLIACSRPGDQAANLQGIWNAEMRAPWSGNFTVNINTEMNYWPAEPANLAECHQPLLALVRDLAVTGAETAKINYGCAGWCAHHNVDLWRQSAPAGDWGAPPADPVWAVWPMGGVWLCQHLWEHYAFGGDANYLRGHAYPVMAGACRFVLDWLVEGEDGRLTTSPSTSPENKFLDDTGTPRALSVGSTADLSMIHDLLTNTIEAAGVLGVDADFVARLRQTLDRLAVPRVLASGRVAEWSHDFADADEHHRHVSHLFGVHPGRQWANDHTMRAAARTSLEVRGNASTGWSLAWKINLWARLGEGEQAHDCVRRLLTVVDQDAGWQAGGVYLNLFDAHPPFQIDGNFGFTAGVCEMLVQSHAGEIHLLPALPVGWGAGRVTGLRARGGVTVDLSWSDGVLVEASLLGDRAGRVKVRYGQAVRTVELATNTPVLVRFR